MFLKASTARGGFALTFMDLHRLLSPGLPCAGVASASAECPPEEQSITVTVAEAVAARLPLADASHHVAWSSVEVPYSRTCGLKGVRQ